MNKISVYICLGVMMFCMSSCYIKNPRYFNSASAHAPAFFEKKGDSRISANIAILPNAEYSVSENVNSFQKTRESFTTGIDINAAYAFSDRYMATIGAYYRKEKDAFSDNDILQTRTTSEIDYTRKAIDMGFGALFPIGQQKKFIFNPIIGVSLGRSESLFNNTCDTISDNRVFFWMVIIKNFT